LKILVVIDGKPASGSIKAAALLAERLGGSSVITVRSGTHATETRRRSVDVPIHDRQHLPEVQLFWGRRTLPKPA
jgi:hypothetical protein